MERIVDYPGATEYRACLDADKVPATLLFRTRRSGDRFFPLGASGSKKLKDFLIDNKIPRSERDRLPILYCTGRAAWIPGIRLSDTFKIGSETRNVLMVEVVKQ